jgi:hypothetical protein
MATMQSEYQQLRSAPEEMAPKQLEDIDAVRAYLTDLLKKGRGEQALEMLLDLLVRMKDAHTATTVRLHDALRQLYGRKSERLNPNQLELFLSELVKGPEGGDDGEAGHDPGPPPHVPQRLPELLAQARPRPGRLERLVCCGDEPHFIQQCLVRARVGQHQVSGVYRVKTTAEEA